MLWYYVCSALPYLPAAFHSNITNFSLTGTSLRFNAGLIPALTSDLPNLSKLRIDYVSCTRDNSANLTLLSRLAQLEELGNFYSGLWIRIHTYTDTG